MPTPGAEGPAAPDVEPLELCELPVGDVVAVLETLSTLPVVELFSALKADSELADAEL